MYFGSADTGPRNPHPERVPVSAGEGMGTGKHPELSTNTIMFMTVTV